MVEFTSNEIDIIENIFINFDIDIKLKLDNIIDRISEVYDEGILNQFDEKDKLMSAIFVVKARLFGEQTMRYNNAKPKYTETMKILKKYPIREFESGQVSTSTANIQYGDIERFGQVTLWGNANEMHPKLIVGKAYEIKFTIKKNFPLQISINKSKNISKSI